jgi:hypothetical protein
MKVKVRRFGSPKDPPQVIGYHAGRRLREDDVFDIPDNMIQVPVLAADPETGRKIPTGDMIIRPKIFSDKWMIPVDDNGKEIKFEIKKSANPEPVVAEPFRAEPVHTPRKRNSESVL